MDDIFHGLVSQLQQLRQPRGLFLIPLRGVDPKELMFPEVGERALGQIDFPIMPLRVVEKGLQHRR